MISKISIFTSAFNLVKQFKLDWNLLQNPIALKNIFQFK